MKKHKHKVSILVVIFSRKHYLAEVPVENKKTLLNHSLWWIDYAKDALKILRTGCCITLKTDIYPIAAKTFFNLYYFKDYVKYVYWTFNDYFLNSLSKISVNINIEDLEICVGLLKEYPVAFDEKMNTGYEQEITFCFRKKISLKEDDRLIEMFDMDTQNRLAVLQILETRLSYYAGQIKSLPKNEPSNPGYIQQTSEKNYVPEIALPIITTPVFLNMVIPTGGDIKNTLKYMESKIIEAEFPHNIFQTIPKNGNENPYGLNHEIAAMIVVFKENGYFKSKLFFKDIYKAFGDYTNNRAGKDYDIDFFKGKPKFEKYKRDLINISIHKLN